MSVEEPGGRAPACSGDAAPYVLGALDDHELAAFREHMSSCAVCRDEVVALQPVVDRLGEAVPPLRAPRRLTRAVIGAARAEPPWRLAFEAADPVPRRPRRRLAPALGGVVVAGAAIAAAVIALAGGGTSTRVIQAHVSSSAAHAVLRLSSGRAQLDVTHLPAPPPGRIYEVWLQRAGQQPTATAALFDVTSSGSGAVDVPGSLNGVQHVLVTAEPYGGSRRPTRPPVIVATLA